MDLSNWRACVQSKCIINEVQLIFAEDVYCTELRDPRRISLDMSNQTNRETRTKKW